MKIKQKILTLLAIFCAVMINISNVGLLYAVQAEGTGQYSTPSSTESSTSSNSDNQPACDSSDPNCVGGVKTSVIKGIECGNTDNIEDSCVWKLLIIGINILSVGIGTLAVGGIIYGALLYTTSDGNTGSTAKAIKTIQNVVFGLIAYAFMYSFLNFIIPGGIF